jgi:hypothetical protein
MFNFEMHTKIRQAQMQEYAKMNQYSRPIQRKPNWLSKIVGKVFTSFGSTLLNWGRKLLKEATEVDLQPTPRSIQLLSE